jgi:hypothetical protein
MPQRNYDRFPHIYEKKPSPKLKFQVLIGFIRSEFWAILPFSAALVLLCKHLKGEDAVYTMEWVVIPLVALLHKLADKYLKKPPKPPSEIVERLIFVRKPLRLRSRRWKVRRSKTSNPIS